MQKVLYLTMDDMKSIGFSDHDFINCVSDIFVQYGQGNAFPLVEMGADLSADKKIRVDSGCVEKSSTIGMRWTASFFNRFDSGVNPNAGVIILSDSDSGIPKVIMDAYYLSAKCTAATLALLARFYARKGAEVLSLLGVNQQGLYNLQAMSQVLKQLKEVRIYDADSSLAKRFAKSIDDDYPYKVLVCESLNEVLKNTDVIVDAELNGAEKPQIPHSYIPKTGVFIATNQISRFAKTTVTMMDKVVTDGLRQADSLSGINIFADLGEVSVGKKTGRQDEAENILAVHQGLFVLEIYTGHKMYGAAKEKGIGIELAPITW